MESTVLTQTLKRKRRRPWASRKFVPRGVDRLSILPDEILSQILILLPTTNEAIRTSILSSRWKYLWTCLSCLNFQYNPCYPWRSSRAKYKSFLNTVNSLFHLSDGRLSIEKFYLFSSYKTQDSLNVDAWTSILINRNMKEFCLQLPNSFVCQFPNCLLTCKTLVALELFGNFEISLPTSVSLPNLKTLYFKSVKYSNSETVQRLLSGCPNLEVLTMMRCITTDDDDGKVLNISVPSLKTLHLYFHPHKFRIHIDDDEIYDYCTIIDAPNLELLQLFDYGSAYICLNNMLSLVKAVIDVRLLEESVLESEGVPTNLMGILLLAISNVKCLTLFNIATYSLSVSYDLHQPKFSKLENLVIDMGVPGSWGFLPNLLECMPNLEELVFLKGLADCVTTKFIWSAPDVVPLCLSFHLKTIVVNNFYGGEDELKLVKYMLDKAKVLEKMTICPCINSQNFVEDVWLVSRDELLKSPLGSSACQINII